MGVIQLYKYTLLALLTVIFLSACSATQTTENNPHSQISSTFSIPVLFENEEKGEYILMGEKEKIGFLIGSGTKSDTTNLIPISANKPNKYMWFLWGENVSGEPFKVIGTNIATNQETVIIDNLVLSSALNGADAHIPSSMVFPSSGLWRLDAYVNDELFGNIVVEVK